MQAAHPNYSTSKSKEETDAEDTFINPLPRAVLRSNTPILLDGEWNFSIDTEDKGLQEEWYLKHNYKHTAQWPGSIEEHIAAANGEPAEIAWKDKVVAWYEREFPLPQRVNGNGSSHSMLQLTFGACGYETRVWLNGILLKTIEGEDVHVGEYTSFSYELREEELQPVNRLTVRIADTMEAPLSGVIC